MKQLFYDGQLIGTFEKYRLKYDLPEDTSNFLLTDVHNPTEISVEKLTLISEQAVTTVIGLIQSEQPFEISIDNKVTFNVKIKSIEDYGIGQGALLFTVRADIVY